MKMTLYKNKLAVWLMVTCFVILAMLVFMTFSQRKLLIDSRKQALQILASEKAMQVNTFLENQKEKQEIIAAMNVFKEVVLYPNDPVIIATAKDRINEIKDTVSGIALFSNEGIIILAESAPAGTDYSKHPYFVSNDKKIMFTKYYDLYQKKDFYVIIGPIYDQTESNKVIGSIGFTIELDNISILMKETLDDGKSDEVYLIDETGLLLSGSKYIGQGNKNGILIQEVDSDGAKECLEHIKKYGKEESVEKHTEEVIQYKNYMGDEVLGAHAYVPEIMGCVIAEESAAEANSSSMLDYIKNMFNK
jgi:hypothetical protein